MRSGSGGVASGSVPGGVVSTAVSTRVSETAGSCVVLSVRSVSETSSSSQVRGAGAIAVDSWVGLVGQVRGVWSSGGCVRGVADASTSGVSNSSTSGVSNSGTSGMRGVSYTSCGRAVGVLTDVSAITVRVDSWVSSIADSAGMRSVSTLSVCAVCACGSGVCGGGVGGVGGVVTWGDSVLDLVDGGRHDDVVVV